MPYLPEPLRALRRVASRATRRRARLATALAVAAVALGCAPRARLAEGPVADDVARGVATGQGTFDHAALDALLVAHVDPRTALVDYAGLARDRARLDGYLEGVASAPLAALSGPEIEALLINAYNAYTLALVLDHLGEVDSIREIDDPWGARRHVVGGHTLSLDDIEHRLLRPVFQDPRIHFAVNCASIGCPPLRAGAYTGAGLDAQLDAATRRALSDPRHARWEDGALALTQIMNWYGEDFTRPGWSPRAGSVVAFVARYAPEELARKLDGGASIRWLEYDWGLNAAR